MQENHKKQQEHYQAIKLEQYNSIEYLSSIEESMKMDSLKENENDQTFCQQLQQALLFFFTNFLSFISFSTITIPIVLMLMLFVLPSKFKAFSGIFLHIWIIICCVSTIYSQIMIYFYTRDNSVEKFIFLDGLYFFLSTMLVMSYIKANIISKHNKWNNVFKNVTDNKSLSTLLYTTDKITDKDAYLFDIQIKQYNSINNNDIQDIEKKIQEQRQQNHDEIQKNFQKLRIQKAFSKFAYFELSKKISMLTQSYPTLIEPSLYEYLPPNQTHFIILVSIIIAKLICSFLYIVIHNKGYSYQKLFDISVIIFWYLFTTWSLNRILGNYDLRRKANALQVLNEYINFKDISDYKSKIDITCPISLDTWDNARQYVCSVDNDYLKYLELAYFCLFYYYIFVALICISSFGEFYWIISKDSTLLEPLIVIMSTFNFLFLNCFILFRIWEGQKYNNSFKTLDFTITYILAITEDLQTMFDLTFNYKKFSKEQQKQQKLDYNKAFSIDSIKCQRNTVYSLIVKKIKLLSKYYLENQIEYHGKLYKINKKSLLRKEILNNMIFSLNKIKRSIHIDSLQLSYKFLNLIPIQFYETLFTLLVTLLTIIPNIIPQIINLYRDIQTPQI